ncbi:hypothetical protein DY000_02059572 [Brassica cretica]|uniref:Letm1 RBD domain-containing protein n=1 Tax=Brassica cretica TaxID=69181 RepID=A0ABQ7AWV1_BRACR|nr:hypothetical protein DY000_02059572 [Brassica cretica]
MRARLVVFPIKGRKWCFSRSVDPLAAQSPSGVTPTTVRGLWKKISSESKPINANAELLVDFISDKMNKAWMGLEIAPEGSMKNKIHGLGLKLLARVKPSEIFLKSISKEVTSVQVSYPPSLDPRLVRRRLRHIAMSGTILHKKYLIGSVTLLPLTTAFTVLPLPNLPFFWVLFRTYSHWRALQGSEKLLKLLSNHSNPQTDTADESNNNKLEQEAQSPTCVLLPSEELYKLLGEASEEDVWEITYEPILSSCFDSLELFKSGTILHKKYLIGSVTLLPLTTAFTVLPLPNLPFFWVLFRTYSHWRALQGSEKLLKLLSNHSNPQTDTADESNNNKLEQEAQSPTCVLLPSEELYKLLGEASEEGLDEETIVEICKLFHLNKIDGSEKLLKLLSNHSNPQTDTADESNNNKLEQEAQSPTCVLLPSEELYKLLGEASEEGLDEETIVEICKLFHLNKIDVLKYRNLV